MMLIVFTNVVLIVRADYRFVALYVGVVRGKNVWLAYLLHTSWLVSLQSLLSSSIKMALLRSSKLVFAEKFSAANGSPNMSLAI